MNPSILSFCVWKTERLLKTLLCLHNDNKISWSSSSAVAKTFLQQRRRLSNSARQKSPPGALQLSASHVFRFLRRVTGWTGRPWSVRFWPSPTTAARAWPWRETLWSAPSPPNCRPPAPRSSRWRWAIAVLVPPSLTRRGTTQLRSHGFLCREQRDRLTANSFQRGILAINAKICDISAMLKTTLASYLACSQIWESKCTDNQVKKGTEK